MKVGDYLADELCQAVRGLYGLEYTVAKKELAKRTGLSWATIDRVTRDVRPSSRARRSDRGQKRVAVAEDVLNFMRGLTVQADYSAEHAIFWAARHFGLPEDFISVSTYNAWLRSERLSRSDNGKDLRPARNFDWLYGNNCHHYDTTVSQAFYANNDGSIGREEKHQRYKNKPGNRKPRIILYALTDDHSRVIFARFYFSENAINLLDFCFRAWSEKGDYRFPFFGIPKHFYADHGAPAKSGKFQHALEVLDVEWINSRPSHATEHGSRAHGKQERVFGEGLLKDFMKETKVARYDSLDAMNDALWLYLIRLNNKRCSTTKEVRFARWLASVGTPRAMPSEEMFALLHYDRAVRVVSRNLQIQLNGKVFQLPFRKPFINWVDCRIECFWSPGKEDVITVAYDFHEEEIPAMPPIVDAGGEYKHVEKTDREVLVEQAKKQSYSDVNVAQIYEPAKDLPYIPKKGKEFEGEIRIVETKPEVTAEETYRRLQELAVNKIRYTRIQSIAYLRGEGFFNRDEALSDEESAWITTVMEGLGKVSPDGVLRIEDEELESAMILARAAAENKAAEEVEVKRHVDDSDDEELPSSRATGS